MVRLSNKTLTVDINNIGAEITSIKSNINEVEYLWQAGVEWPKQSPLLFPIIGRLKDSEYILEDRKYTMGSHGFAKGLKFDIIEKEKDMVLLRAMNNKQTFSQYPYKFALEVCYRLKKDTLHVYYSILNLGQEPMIYAIGGHPAFSCNLKNNEGIIDYYLEFTNDSKIESYMVDMSTKLLTKDKYTICEEKSINLTKDLFRYDSLVFENKDINTVTLKSKNHNHYVRLDFHSFPYFAIWSKQTDTGLADFVCLEPWLGLPDFNGTNKQLANKEGCRILDPETTFDIGYSISVG